MSQKAAVVLHDEASRYGARGDSVCTKPLGLPDHSRRALVPCSLEFHLETFRQGLMMGRLGLAWLTTAPGFSRHTGQTRRAGDTRGWTAGGSGAAVLWPAWSGRPTSGLLIRKGARVGVKVISCKLVRSWRSRNSGRLDHADLAIWCQDEMDLDEVGCHWLCCLFKHCRVRRVVPTFELHLHDHVLRRGSIVTARGILAASGVRAMCAVLGCARQCAASFTVAILPLTLTF
mmetsp:Transcript_43945/g.111170  ORF Transcript_43945/g.111170 Transcript_43945/m.111170 type:complete len:231 (-) Transcript_43945:766-1458(-)